MMPTLPSLVAPEVVILTTFGATSDDKVGIMTILGFQWNMKVNIIFGKAYVILQ